MKRSVLLTGVIGVSVALLMPGALSMPAVAVAETHCAPGWRFTQMSKKRVRMRVHERRRIENKSGSTATVTFSSKKSKTVKMSATASVEASYNAIFTSVKAKLDASVERSVTAEIGESVSYSLKNNRAALGRYGVFIRRVRGLLTRGDSTSGCTFYRRVTAYLPRESGWRVGSEAL